MSDPISTGCSPIDALLGGGFERGQVTQLYGPPASGKTNLALSATVETAAQTGTPHFIDTEGVSTDRFQQIAQARTESADDFDALVSRVNISAAHDFQDQEEAVKDVAEVATQVDLIVLDSATGFYRLERTEREEGDALRSVARQITHLLSLARRYDLAVVFTNQVFTDPETERPRPLGGHTLMHWSNTVLRLERFRGEHRRATLEQHPAKATGDRTRFVITGSGLTAPEQ